jgi:PAS domain S-box-containing protein
MKGLCMDPNLRVQREKVARPSVFTSITFMKLLRHRAAAWIILVASLLLTAAVWYISNTSVIRSASARFNYRADDIKDAIASRMKEQEDVLRGGVGLFAALDTVDRKQWRTYVQKLELEKNFPGLLGYGFSLLVHPRDLATHIQGVRNEGFPTYDVWPVGQREIYTSIIYLEPFANRNLRAFGYDMFSEPERRAAMERARDTGASSVSGMITLVQETEKDVQRGFLMYLPVYRAKQLLETAEARREALIGYVYSPFRINDLMTGILGGASDIGFKIFDAGAAIPERVLYNFDAKVQLADLQQRSVFTSTRSLTIGGRTWTLLFYAGPEYLSISEKIQPIFVAVGGTLINLLLFLFLGSIAKQQERAEKLAKDMTVELNDAAIRTKAIIETVVDGLITINEDGIVESVNPSAEKLFGYSSAELIGKNVKVLMPDPYHSEHDSYLNRYRREGGARIIGRGREVSGKRKDGSIFPMDLGVSEMWLGTTRLFVGTVRDITERKQVERLKNEFISVVSHELRTPLTSIRGSLGLIAGGATGELNPKAGELIRIAYKNSERLTNLINDILDVEKIESGLMQFDLRPQELMPLVEQAVEANLAYARQLGVELEITTATRGIQIQVDADRFMQVMANLLSNAAKFSPPQGRVEISITQHDSTARISVRDHGNGIPSEFQGRIFQKFSQADSSETRTKGGSGLGLSISKAIVEQMKGRIYFETSIGEGTVFHVVLPLWVESPSIIGEEDTSVGSLPRVLVCEDDPDIAKLITLMLKQNGFEADIAPDAAKAGRMLHERTYVAMTLDLALPDRDGISLLRELRVDARTRDLPIIVVSANVEAGRAQINGGFGVLDWLGKPIDQYRLLAALKHCLHNETDRKPRVLHVEDDPDIGRIVSSVVGDIADFDIAGSLRDARAKLRTHQYELVILDVSLPDGAGWDLLNSIKGMDNPPPILIFSASDVGVVEAQRVTTALVKSRTSNDELAATIKQLLQKSMSTPPARVA